MTEISHDDRAEFEEMKRAAAAEMSQDLDLNRRALDVWIDADRYSYSYEWTWLGVPIIQIPPDIVATQEIIWACRPQLIVETGIARGGSAILSSSILELIGDGRVLAIDIDIRAHNREAIEAHPLSRRIDLIEGSSVDPAVVAKVAARASAVERVMVILDSNHTHQHVLAELEAYAPMVTPGQFLIVADTVIEHIPVQTHRPRPWAPGNSPATALDDYAARFSRFEVDPYVNAKLLMTSSPGGYLRCVSP
jgi:cephalosporin hydroxylase